MVVGEEKQTPIEHPVKMPPSLRAGLFYHMTYLARATEK